MPPTWGVTSAGFAAKPTTQILSDLQNSILASINPQLDLSPQTPDGQMLGIIANEFGSNWELLQVAWNQFNREDAEGAGLDNLGDLTGTPREGQSYTVVLCNLVISNGTYAAGSLTANVNGSPSQAFSNLNAVVVTGGAATGVPFQSTNPGVTPAVNPGTLTQITTPVTGWTSVTNPDAQTQLGQGEESDAAYALRQAQEIAGEGSCNPSATADALIKLGIAQTPPVNLNVTIVENNTPYPSVVGGVYLPPQSYQVFVYDQGTGWATGAGAQLIGQTIYNNKPAGIEPVGVLSVTISDAILGNQTVFYSVPNPETLYVTATVVPRPGVAFATLQAAIVNALAQAAVAQTPPNGTPPNGQLAPGVAVVGSQLEAVIMGVPGVFDVKSLFFDFAPSPSNTQPLTVGPFAIATLSSTNIVIHLGTYP